LTILRSSFFGGFGGTVGADAEEDGGGDSFAFSTLAEDARVIWLRRRYCFCCLRVNELVVVVVVELNWLVNECVANIMVSLLKKKSASARAFTKNFCGEKVWDRELSLNGVTRPPRRNGWGSAKGKIFWRKKNLKEEEAVWSFQIS
jgi:hypothetical protein